MTEQVSEALRIRFVKLHFKLVFPQKCELPKDKASALRGGMGQMLLQANCIRDRQCETCDFESECIVQRMMYSKFEKKPDFVTTGESIGYVFECEDYREQFEAGDVLKFQMILFGKTIVYFHQYVQAFYTLGMHAGLGKNHARFEIAEIANTDGQTILKDGNIDMQQYKVQLLSDYVKKRKKQFPAKRKTYTVVFDTPLTLKFQGEFLKAFQPEAMIASIRRRIYMLDCYENQESTIYPGDQGQIPDLVKQKAHTTGVRRYSTRQDSKMVLHGIKGYAVLEKLSEECLDLLLAGELIHIGKNTSFGFGRYHVSQTE